MKAKFLKLAGVKNEKEFYKKFPTEEAFMAKYGKQLEKADDGFYGLIKPPAMPKVDMVNLADTKGFGLTKLKDPGKSPNRGFDWEGLAESVAPVIGPLIGNIQQISQENKDIANARKYAKISDLTLQAAQSRPEPIKRKYVRPEDQLTQTVNPLGVGTNYLAAANGAMIGGNPTEIQNTYNPNTLYDDLGFEPLNDSKVKQYKKGGKLKKAAGGINLDPFADVFGGLGGALGSATGKGSGKGGAASQIGSTIGGIAGSFIPIPGIGTALGSLVGGFAGGLFDSGRQNELQEAEDKLNANLQAAAFQSGAQNIQSQNKGFMEEGGWVSHDWQPQVIAKFGEYNVKDLLKPPHDADMLRAGGHLKEYTAPSERAMYTGREQFAMGGDLQVGRGKAETMSYNPFLPDGGETIMFRGPSHEDGGMPISYGANGVEVEGGEPAVVMKNGGEAEGNLVVYGNMVIPDYGVADLGKEAKGKKFKNYVADLSKIEAKQGKIVDKSTNAIDEIDGDDQFDQLAINANHANIMGANMKLKDIADKKKTAAALQNAILDTAEEFGVESDALSKGKMKAIKENSKYAKFGAKLETAEDGTKINTSALLSKFIPEASAAGYIPDLSNQIAIARASEIPKTLDNVTVLGKRFQGMQPKQLPVNIPLPELKRIAQAQNLEDLGTTTPKTKTKGNYNWVDTALTGLDSVLPFLRPSNAGALDPRQLASEMYTLQDQVQPVQAQLYNPMLQAQPYRISLQDQLNEVTAQTRSAERMAQGNPAALAMIAAQGEQAKSKILGEQFRMNQAEQARAAETNRAQLNDAQLKNLGILDQQYVRQEQAKSNTVENRRRALNSIAEKFQKNKLENKTLGIMENMYNYRFGPSGQAYNLNPAVRFNLPDVGYGASSVEQIGGKQTPKELRALADLQEEQEKKATKSSKRNGAIVKAIKNL